ncbi:MAG TPA: MFS transporter [Ramlibacter sp.]|nr:MFS transporter [Ramlibacter sp.]
MKLDRALLVIAAGVTAAVHVAKLPPALPALRESLGITLVEAGFLISMVQVAGMTLGLVVGLAADTLGLRRTMVAGLALLSAASLASSMATSAVALLSLRALEGAGFLLAVTTGPALIRRMVASDALTQRLGLWGTYMPLGTALALLCGPGWIAHLGWPSWWWLASLLTAVMAFAVWRAVPADPRSGAAAAPTAWQRRLRETLGAPGPWLVSLTFAAYSSQWIAMVGFLPSIYAQAGMAPSTAGLATALAAGVNMVGNVASGRLIHKGFRPERLLQTGFVVMALAAVLAFAPVWPQQSTLAVVGPYLAVLAFSSVGGLVPGTLFSLSVRLAPHPGAVSTTVGLLQQWSALGQFVGPPLVAWVASRTGGWSWSWLVTCACAACGLALAQGIGAFRRRLEQPAPGA